VIEAEGDDGLTTEVVFDSWLPRGMLSVLDGVGMGSLPSAGPGLRALSHDTLYGVAQREVVEG
jgi:hypothetical protein